MLALKTISLLLGCAFSIFGFLIFVKKKYNLINGFEEAFKRGTKSEGYAKAVGLTELIIGITLLLCGIILLILF